MVKGDWGTLPGRKIETVVVHDSPREPRVRIVLLFADGAYFEIYSGSGDLKGTSQAYSGGLRDVLHHYRGDGQLTVFRDDR